MRAPVRVVAGVGLALGLALGASPAAQASTGHHHKASGKSCHAGCHHAPKPPGGWPCSATHTCPPPKPCPPRHPHKPPVTPPTTVEPKPPVVTPPAKPSAPVVQRSVPNTPVPQASPELPRTGGFYEQGLYGAAGLLLVGAGLIRGSKWTRS